MKAVAVSLSALVAVLSVAARAASPAAEALFEEGRRLMAAGQTAEACARFAESNALEPSSGKLLNLALCHETQGKTATAWAEYRATARLARTEARADREATADAKAAALEPKLARLTTVAPNPPPPGLKVSIEEGSLDTGGLGVAIPIDPGVHKVAAAAPGYLAWTGTVEIAEAEQKRLEIPVLEPEPKLPPRPSEAPLAPLTPVAAASPAPTQQERPGILVVPSSPPSRSPHFTSFELYAAGGGAALAVAGTVLYFAAYSKFNAAKSACNQGLGCADRDSRVSTIEALEFSGVGAWVAGGGLLAASGLHYWLHRERTAIDIAAIPWGSGFVLSGDF